MADLAASGAAEAARLADREGREVVVQHEGLFVGAFKRVDILLVLAGAERGDHQRLGLAAGEQRRAMGARQHRSLAHDRPHGDEIAPVDALAGIEDAVADDVLLEMLERFADLVGAGASSLPSTMSAESTLSFALATASWRSSFLAMA